MKTKLKSAIEQKQKIIWLDEIMFTKTTNLTHEWSKRTENVHIPFEAMGTRYTAVIAAISEGRGFYYYELHDEAINQKKFASFLNILANINKRKKVSLVMDNLRVHTTLPIQNLMSQLKMECIYNVPYSPQFNAIELPFGQVKKKFKELKL